MEVNMYFLLCVSAVGMKKTVQDKEETRAEAVLRAGPLTIL